ncbi:MAG: M81 family metallopeptidase [Burkholderiaceae bacterium]
MKIFCAGLATETNTFASAPTGWRSFEEYGVYRGDSSTRVPEGGGALLRCLRDAAEAEGHTVCESIVAFAQPSGRTVRVVYEELRDQILQDLRAAMPVQVVLLGLHGAMVAEGYDDCEGDLLARVRAIVGPDVAVGAELDLHCHFTELMRRSADALVAYKEYPHTDGLERALELYRILVDTAQGRVRPTTAVFDCRMVGIWHTTTEPMAGFVKRMQSFEGRDGVLSVSLGHGFPWGDVADNGARLWVITDNDEAGAARLAARLGREFIEMREATRSPTLGVEAALDRVLARHSGDPRPVVMADVADNAGGGAPADSTFILQAVLARGIGNAVLGPFWDLGAVHICRDAGVGAVIDLRVGGKCGPSSGDPVDIRVTVRAVREEHAQDVFGMRWPLGPSVWVETDQGVSLMLSSVRSQAYGTDLFTGLGITLHDKQLIVVKSTQHFHAAYAPVAREVLYVDTPGAITQDYARIPFKVRSLDYWPRVADPWGKEA